MMIRITLDPAALALLLDSVHLEYDSICQVRAP
ncbi:MAG: hypothetical protein ACI9ZF_001063 [Bradyrhizobium sp.]|jgi:hypothetical protein